MNWHAVAGWAVSFVAAVIVDAALIYCALTYLPL